MTDAAKRPERLIICSYCKEKSTISKAMGRGGRFLVAGQEVQTDIAAQRRDVERNNLWNFSQLGAGNNMN